MISLRKVSASARSACNQGVRTQGKADSYDNVYLASQRKDVGMMGYLHEP